MDLKKSHLQKVNVLAFRQGPMGNGKKLPS